MNEQAINVLHKKKSNDAIKSVMDALQRKVSRQLLSNYKVFQLSFHIYCTILEILHAIKKHRKS